MHLWYTYSMQQGALIIPSQNQYLCQPLASNYMVNVILSSVHQIKIIMHDIG